MKDLRIREGEEVTGQPYVEVYVAPAGPPLPARSSVIEGILKDVKPLWAEVLVELEEMAQEWAEKEDA